MSVEVKASGNSFEVGSPKTLFRTGILGGYGGGPTIAWRYAISKDGQRFLINNAPEEIATAPMTIDTNWTAELKK